MLTSKLPTCRTPVRLVEMLWLSGNRPRIRLHIRKLGSGITSKFGGLEVREAFTDAIISNETALFGPVRKLDVAARRS